MGATRENKIIKICGIALLVLLAIGQGAAITIGAEITISDTNAENNFKTIEAEVIETKNINIIFRPIDSELENLDLTVEKQSEFLKKIYPISENGISKGINKQVYYTGIEEGHKIAGIELTGILWKIYIDELLSRGLSFDRIVGIFPDKWFEKRGSNRDGFTKEILGFGTHYTPAIFGPVLIEEDNLIAASHEIGHTYTLCDEYSFADWSEQDNRFFFGCGNEFPESCLENPENCLGNSNISGFNVREKKAIESALEIFYLENMQEGEAKQEEEEAQGKTCQLECNPSECRLICSSYYCIMGKNSNIERAWISEDAYSRLLTQFSATQLLFSQDYFSSLGDIAYYSSSDQSLLLSGLADKNGEVILQDFYVIDSVQEEEIPAGDYSLKLLDDSNNVLLNQSFGISYILLSDPPIDLNTTGFVFTVPFPEGTHKIQIDFNGATRAERLVSPNTPVVSFTTPSGGEQWSTTQLVEWTASDLDNDSLSFVLQYSSDNGLTWNPITIDLNETHFLLDAAALPPSEQTKLKVIATDGVNTSSAESGTFAIMNPKIEAEPWLIDFGETTQGTILEYNIGLQNTGNQNLEIQGIQTNEQTTYTGISFPTTLAPGQGTEFQLFFNTSDLNGEYDQNALSIQSNDPKRGWKNIYLEGTINEPEIIDGNIHLTDMNSYTKEKEYYSGAATAKIILDYIRTATGYSQISQDKLQFYGNLNKDQNNQTVLELDAKAMDAVLGHYDPYDSIVNDEYDSHDSRSDGNPFQGYNYTVEAFSAEQTTEYMTDIIHWMAYPVTIQAWWKNTAKATKPHTPAAIPIYGNYSHWIALNGFTASENPTPEPETNPWKTMETTIYGFWLTDPAQDGIGQHVYVTAADANAIYFKPMQTNDQYNGKLIQVAEPPPMPPTEEGKMQIQAMGGAMKMATNMAMATTAIMPTAIIARPVPKPENIEMLKKIMG